MNDFSNNTLFRIGYCWKGGNIAINENGKIASVSTCKWTSIYNLINLLSVVTLSMSRDKSRLKFSRMRVVFWAVVSIDWFYFLIDHVLNLHRPMLMTMLERHVPNRKFLDATAGLPVALQNVNNSYHGIYNANVCTFESRPIQFRPPCEWRM